MTDKKAIVFYVEPAEYDVIMFNARSKGYKKAGDYARSALFGWINKYPCKGIFSALHIDKIKDVVKVEYTPMTLDSERKR